MRTAIVGWSKTFRLGLGWTALALLLSGLSPAAAIAQTTGIAGVVKDTTGAGDCFVGAFLSAQRSGASLAESGRFANAAQSLFEQVKCLGHAPALFRQSTARDSASNVLDEWIGGAGDDFCPGHCAYNMVSARSE